MSIYDNMKVGGKKMDKIMVAGAVAGAIAASAGFIIPSCL